MFKKYILSQFFIVKSVFSHFYSTMSSSDGSLTSRSSEDTDIDVADYDLKVVGPPNSSAQGSDQEALRCPRCEQYIDDLE